MSMQHNGYIWEKGRTQGNLTSLVCRNVIGKGQELSYLNSSRGFSGVYQLTFTTLSYSSNLLIAIGM